MASSEKKVKSFDEKLFVLIMKEFGLKVAIEKVSSVLKILEN